MNSGTSSTSKIDHRREKLYRDRGQRQVIPSGGISRYEFENNMSLSLQDSVSSLSYPPRDRDDRVSASRKRSAPTDNDSQTECDCPPNFRCIHRRKCDEENRAKRQWIGDHIRMDEEAFERKTAAASQSNSKPMRRHRVAAIMQYLDTIDETPWNMGSIRHLTFNNIREWIIEANCHDVEPQDLRSTRVLPRLKAFLAQAHSSQRDEKGVTDFLFEELLILYQKWKKGDYLCDPNRGLIKKEIQDVNGTTYQTKYQLDKSWPFYAGQYYGEGSLVNGQIWYTREQLMRDGAHNSIQAGISGTAGDGARSIVMGLDSHTNQYGDIDHFDTVYYEGTSLSAASTDAEPQPTSATKALMKSQETENAVRVIRSFRLPVQAFNGSAKGYRYDGLYQVTNHELKDKRLQKYVFTLKRLKGQGTLRGIKRDDPVLRPQKKARTTTARRYNFGAGRSRSSLSIRGPPRGY